LKILSAVECVLMLFSYSRRVDGLWIGVFGNRRDRLLLSRVESPPSEQVIRYMATELRDQNFGVDEIKAAFEAAIHNLARYSRGYNKRSDDPSKRTH
jgi:hypothetical protein